MKKKAKAAAKRARRSKQKHAVNDLDQPEALDVEEAGEVEPKATDETI